MGILEDLAAGNTVAEAARRYAQRHQEDADIDGFLDVLAAEGFIVRAQDNPQEAHSHGGEGTRGFISLNWISPRVAAALTSAPALLVYLAVVGLGVGLYLADPGTLPSTTALRFYGGHYALALMITFVCALGGTMVHELAHAVAARAVGVPVTLGFGNLLYVMVAQTNITGIQLASKPRRYLAVVAGTLADLVSGSVILALLYADRHGMIALPQLAGEVLAAVLYTYLLRSFAQTFFYVRTDFYYLFANVFNCRNLLSDTETLLKNGLRRMFGRTDRLVDQSHIPAKERGAIRLYAAVYLIGRGFAFAMLFFFIIPLLGYVLWQFGLYATGQPSYMHFVDFLAMGGLLLFIYGGGIVMWTQSLRRAYRRRRAARQLAGATA